MGILHDMLDLGLTLASENNAYGEAIRSLPSKIDIFPCKILDIISAKPGWSPEISRAPVASGAAGARLPIPETNINLWRPPESYSIKFPCCVTMN
ncbi:hypothetical protein BT96DRAFT_95084 [Gymnopus androsaceus JB14]|uniref:Uncharacterized protein n=1 Tax=Gymnopus androsaceus JB14 TaxID=1447944 RepID=A0A6A4HEK9_9AGAR|nr:hypothetical protein BT96DRAFT_95084 [Gymnopus androsaceus JB14]